MDRWHCIVCWSKRLVKYHISGVGPVLPAAYKTFLRRHYLLLPVGGYFEMSDRSSPRLVRRGVSLLPNPRTIHPQVEVFLSIFSDLLIFKGVCESRRLGRDIAFYPNKIGQKLTEIWGVQYNPLKTRFLSGFGWPEKPNTGYVTERSTNQIRQIEMCPDVSTNRITKISFAHNPEAIAS